jgi:hypothetical protein
VLTIATSAGRATTWPANPKLVTPRHRASVLKRCDRHHGRRAIQLSHASSENRRSPRRENAKPARSHGSGRIGRPEKATALGESSLDLVVPAPRPPARGVKRARVLSAFFPSPFSEKVHIYRF